MRRTLLVLALCVICLLSGFLLRPLVSRAFTSLAVPPTPADLVTPVAEREDRHAEIMADLARRTVPPDVVVIGDSITDLWRDHPDSWNGCFGPNAVNLGVKWDRVENVLWRVQAGELGGVKPKLIVLLIGSNNLFRGDKPEAVAAGIGHLLGEVKAKAPDARILLLSVLPRESAFDASTRRAVRDCNELLGRLGDDRVTVLNAGHLFVREDGVIDPTLMPDDIHPSAAGYERLADAIRPVAERLVR